MAGLSRLFGDGLHNAAKEFNLDKVEQCVRQGCDINKQAGKVRGAVVGSSAPPPPPPRQRWSRAWHAHGAHVGPGGAKAVGIWGWMVEVLSGVCVGLPGPV